MASSYGQMAYASGQFANAGDAQASLFVVRCATTNAVTRELFLDGVGASRRLQVPNNTVWTFEILVAARSSTNNKRAAYTATGIIHNVGGFTSATATVNTLYENDTGWNVSVGADDVNDTLLVAATGNTGDTIRWVASVRTAEVTC